MSALATLLAAEPLDSLWKISAGLVAPLMLEGIRRTRKFFVKVDAMADQLGALQGDIHLATAATTEHSAAILNLTTQLATQATLVDVMRTEIAPPLTEMAKAATALLAARVRATDPSTLDPSDQRAIP